MDLQDNPYRPGAGEPPEALAGRDEIINDFGIALRRAAKNRPGKGLTLLGLRGSGKTVLIGRLLEIAENEKAHCVFLEAPRSDEFAERLASQAHRLLADLDRLGQTKQAISKAFRVLSSFALHFPDGTALSFGIAPEAGLADTGLLAADLVDLFLSLGAAAASRDVVIVFAIDEAHELKPEALGALLEAVHRTTQKNLPIALVLAGLPHLRSLCAEARTYAERMLAFEDLNFLSATAAREAIEWPANNQGVSFDAEATDYIIEKAQGYPYFLQEWGYCVWQEMTDTHVSIAAAKAATTTVQMRLDKYLFKTRYERATPQEQCYLLGMAQLGPGQHKTSDIAKQIGKKAVQLAPYRASLIDKGLIYSPAYGSAAFSVPMFDEYLLRTLEEDPSDRHRP